MRRAFRTRALVLGALLLCLPALLAATAPADLPTAAAVAGLVLTAVLVAVGSHTLVVVRTTGGPRPPLIAEERRLRGSFRRQSAPDTPGCPRRPRAPGRARTA